MQHRLMFLTSSEPASLRKLRLCRKSSKCGCDVLNCAQFIANWLLKTRLSIRQTVEPPLCVTIGGLNVAFRPALMLGLIIPSVHPVERQNIGAHFVHHPSSVVPASMMMFSQCTGPKSQVESPCNSMARTAWLKSAYSRIGEYPALEPWNLPSRTCLE